MYVHIRVYKCVYKVPADLGGRLIRIAIATITSCLAKARGVKRYWYGKSIAAAPVSEKCEISPSFSASALMEKARGGHVDLLIGVHV